jgi:hypothetical protein
VITDLVLFLVGEFVTRLSREVDESPIVLTQTPDINTFQHETEAETIYRTILLSSPVLSDKKVVGHPDLKSIPQVVKESVHQESTPFRVRPEEDR